MDSNSHFTQVEGQQQQEHYQHISAAAAAAPETQKMLVGMKQKNPVCISKYEFCPDQCCAALDCSIQISKCQFKLRLSACFCFPMSCQCTDCCCCCCS